MPSLSLALNDTPQDLYTALSLDTTKDYTVQNNGGIRVYFWEDDSAPTPENTRGLYLEPGGMGVFTAPDTGAIWFWSDEPGSIGTIESLP